jgi:hypothetical protein
VEGRLQRRRTGRVDRGDLFGKLSEHFLQATGAQHTDKRGDLLRIMVRHIGPGWVHRSILSAASTP